MFRTVITGTGSFIPFNIQSNQDFSNQTFYSEAGEQLNLHTETLIKKFREITGIAERRYADKGMMTSDIGIIAAEKAIVDSGIDREEIDQVIVAHNFGDVISGTIQTDAVPSLASRIKHALKIKNPNCTAYDILFGCPGWVQGLIHADAFFKAGIAAKALIIGAETLSRVIDCGDRDSMIFSDGAGAVIVEYKEVNDTDGQGILSTASQSHTAEEFNYIHLGKSYTPGTDPRVRFIKMKGRKVYEYAMKYVPAAMKYCYDKTQLPIERLKKIFIHQANEKMDDGIIKRLYELYNMPGIPENIMPMSIHWLGNSSVATIPTLYDLVVNHEVLSHELNAGDIIMFASVGAGMNVNAVCYRY